LLAALNSALKPCPLAAPSDRGGCGWTRKSCIFRAAIASRARRAGSRAWARCCHAEAPVPAAAQIRGGGARRGSIPSVSSRPRRLIASQAPRACECGPTVQGCRSGRAADNAKPLSRPICEQAICCRGCARQPLLIDSKIRLIQTSLRRSKQPPRRPSSGLKAKQSADAKKAPMIAPRHDR